MMIELPGAVGITHLTVYPRSGTPHMHLCCAESYVVTGGSGRVQTLTLKGYKETQLKAGAVVWFPPGTIHRLINDNDLEIVVLMQNSGLPEAGDAVMTFPAEVVADPLAYAKAATLKASGLESAFERRALAVSGFDVLREAAAAGDLGPLKAFHAAAINIVRPQLPEWRRRWAAGAMRVAQDTGAQLDSLSSGVAPHLSNADVYELAEPTERGRRGMCGLLDTYMTRD
jgi:mannose-6-phosphate isomerase-like protein (cupin superfamily)